jgi:very-short-patch-repair endonuclease
VLRFWNDDVLTNPEGVHSVIASVLLQSHPHPTSPIEGEG